MRASWTAVLAAFVVFLVAPLAHAGTAEDPEVSDAGGDSVSTQDGLGAAGADLVKAWYTEDGDNVLFHFESGGMCADSTETIEYRWIASVGDDVAFGADLFGQGALCFSGEDDTTISATGAATAASFTGNVATLTIPRTAFGDGADGTVLSGTFGTALAYVGDPAAWNDSDRAPDDGGGRDYVLGGVVDDGPVLQVINVTDPELQHAQSATTPLDAAFLLNWDGPANVTFALTIEGAGNITVDVLDPSGGSQFDCVCTDGTNETLEFMSEAGRWSVNITYAGFTGDASLHMYPTPEPGAGNEPQDPDDGGPDDGNTTDDEDAADGGDDGGEDSPLPFFVLLVALMVAAVRARR